MENDKIKLGVVGAGRMGITHISIMEPNPYSEISAICEPSKLIGSIFSKYMSNVKIYSDYKKMIQNERLDGLIVSTPPNMHKEICEVAIENRINLFVEKPFTASLMDAIELTEKIKDSNLVGQVGYVNRFNDMFIKAKELINLGVIGEVIRFKSEIFSFTISKPDAGTGWRGSIKSGGGALFEMGSHAIDLVNYLIGVPDKVIGSTLNRVYSKNVEDVVSSTLLYKSGISGNLFVNWVDPCYRKPSNKIEIFAKEGKIIVSQHELKIFLKSDNVKCKLKTGWNTIYITDVFKPVNFYVRGNEFTAQLYHFIDCIKDKQTVNICSFSDGADTHKVIDAIFNDYELNGKI